MPERYEGQYEANLNAYEISLKYTVAERRQILTEMREWQKRALEAEAKLDAIHRGNNRGNEPTQAIN